MNNPAVLKKIAITHDRLRVLNNIWAFHIEHESYDREMIMQLQEEITEMEQQLIELKARVCL